jgi:magnesium transporter
MQVLDRLDRERISELRRRDEFFWVDLHSPAEEDVEQLGEIFGFHPVALEDTSHFGQRPKLDEYGDYALLVYYGVGTGEDEEPDPVEVHLFLHGSFIITVHRDPCDQLDDLRDRLADGGKPNETYIVYRIIDSLTDTFFPVLDRMDDEIEGLEDAVVARPTNEQRARIFRLRSSLVTLRKLVTPQRDIFARAIDSLTDIPGLEAGGRDYFRDVYDHLIRISELVDSYRDLLSGLTDVYLTTVSNRLNETMKRLTVIATIFLPLTFVTGFFGQNFGWMVRHIGSAADFWGLGVGGCLAAGVAIWAWIRMTAEE